MVDQEPCPTCGALPCDWVDNPHTRAPTPPPVPPPVPAVTREELVEIMRPWIEAAMDSAIPEPWEVAANCANGAADAILSRLAAGQKRDAPNA